MKIKEDLFQFFREKVIKTHQQYRTDLEIDRFESNYKLFNKAVQDNSYLVINAARQVGVTTMLISYALSNLDKSVVWVTNNTNMADFVRSSIKCIGFDDDNRSKIANIKFISPKEEAMRGLSYDILIIDNAGDIKFDRNLMDIWRMNGNYYAKIIIAGTPMAENNVLYKIWEHSLLGTTDFKRIILPHNLIGNSYNEYLSRMNVNSFKEEYLNEFIGNNNIIKTLDIELKNKYYNKLLLKLTKEDKTFSQYIEELIIKDFTKNEF